MLQKAAFHWWNKEKLVGLEMGCGSRRDFEGKGGSACLLVL